MHVCLLGVKLFGSSFFVFYDFRYVGNPRVGAFVATLNNGTFGPWGTAWSFDGSVWNAKVEVSLQCWFLFRLSFNLKD
jgi:hypothetical protein